MADKQSFFEQNLDLFKHVIGQNPSSLSGIKSGDTSFAIRDQDFAAVKNALGGLDAVMLCVEGIGKEIAEVFALTQSEYFTRKRAIYLVARQAVHFAPLFELADFKNIINSERVFFFADDIHGSLEEFFQTNTAKPLPTGVICLGVGDELYTRTTSSVQQCHNWRNKRIEQLKNELFAHYADLDAGKVFESGRSLTLFSFTSRFTSYVRYCTFDCAEAFNQAGHNMQIWIESHDTDRLNGLVLLENLCRIKPDAVFSIDHTRYEHAGVYPENLPFITWVQDQLPAIFDEQTACDSGSLDFFFTSGFRQRMLNLGFRPERVFSFIECTNFRRFYPLEGKTDKKFEAQVSFVSHASSTPLQEFEAFLSEFTQLGAPEVLLDFARKFYVRLESFFASGKALYGYKEYEKLFDELCAEYGLEFAGVLAPLGRAVFERFYHVIGNRFFRHMPLLWAAEMGVDLKLWGHGWEKHPALGRFACGVADNEAELNSVFCGSAVNLHLSHHTDVVHPRLLDCMSAGGNCLIRTNGLFTWKNFFIFESMWFDSKADFYQKIDFMLDKKNSDINRKIAHKLVDSVSCNYSYDTGVEYILEALKMSFAADKTGFVEIVKRADAITIAGDFKRVVGGLLPVKHQEYLSQQAFLLVHAVCGAKRPLIFARL